MWANRTRAVQLLSEEQLAECDFDKEGGQALESAPVQIISSNYILIQIKDKK